jgi:hypothetical protein
VHASPDVLSIASLLPALHLTGRESWAEDRRLKSLNFTVITLEQHFEFS